MERGGGIRDRGETVVVRIVYTGLTMRRIEGGGRR